MNPMLMMALLGGMGGMGGGQPQQPGGQQQPAQPQQGQFPAMTAYKMLDGSVGDLPTGSPMGAMARPKMSGADMLGVTDPRQALAQMRGVLNAPSQVPVGKPGMWDKFGAYLNGMPTDERLMLGMSGLDGLMRTLSGKL